MLSISVILSLVGFDTLGDFIFIGIIVYLVAMGVPEELYVGIFKRKE